MANKHGEQVNRQATTVVRMDKAKPFDAYFTDEDNPEKRQFIDMLRRIVHDLVPDVVEKVAYAQPGFYPAGTTKATQMFFLFLANAKWLGMYGTFGFADIPENAAFLSSLGVGAGKGSLQVPYSLSEEKLRQLVTAVIAYNQARRQTA